MTRLALASQPDLWAPLGTRCARSRFVCVCVCRRCEVHPLVCVPIPSSWRWFSSLSLRLGRTCRAPFRACAPFPRRDDNICRLAQGKCAAEEVNITIVHVKGAMCSPVCGVMDSCPKDVPAGVTVVHALLFPSLTSVECCSPSSAAQHACQSRIRLREHIRRPTRSVRCRTWPGASSAPSSAACRCRFSTRYERCLG